jgi:glycosyltransferase involved in cell wall biosynthesis
MTVSVIVPSRKSEEDIARGVERMMTGYHEFIVSTEGNHPAVARNAGAARATGDYLLFVDADMDLRQGGGMPLDVSSLESYGYDVATANYLSEVDPAISTVQRLMASVGSPFAFFGGFMWISRAAWKAVGQFREFPVEDVEWGLRAWRLGWRIDVFPIYVYHTRPFRWAHAIGSYVSSDAVWGVP